jgi:hypothetical protein
MPLAGAGSRRAGGLRLGWAGTASAHRIIAVARAVLVVPGVRGWPVPATADSDSASQSPSPFPFGLQRERGGSSVQRARLETDTHR